MIAVEIVFWLAALAIVYTYFLYPVVLMALSALKQLRADLRYVSRRYGNAANTVWDGGYTLLGAMVSHKVSKNVQVSLRGRNLTDKVYAANVTGTPMFYLGAPRSLELMLQATF